MAVPYFMADSASVTVLRSLASTAFGKYNLTLPDGVNIDDVYEVSAEGNELAYVASLGARRRVGGMVRRFVRADVNVTAQGEGMVPASDVERVLDEAAKRVSGDFFLESDISKAGLGPWVPMVDFHVGDIANVEIWGRVVPLAVTRIEPKRTEHSDNDWSVHVGGQLLSDSEARLAENADIYNAVVSDRRDLAGLEAKASQAAAAASRAQSTADTARDEVAAVRDTLAGEQAQEPDLLAQLVAVNAELQRLGAEQQPSLMLAFVELSTKLWEAQRVLDAAQDDFASQTREQADSQAELLSSVQAQVGEVSQSIWSLGTAGDGFWAVSGNTVTATGTWVGEAILDVNRQYAQRVVDRVNTSGGGSTTDITLEERSVTKVQVGTTRSWTFPSNVSALLAHYRQAAGTVRKWEQEITRQVAGASWTRLSEFTATRAAPHSVNFTVGWDAAHRGATYGVRVVVDGAVHKTLSRTNLGPIFSSGNGYRTQQVSVTLDLAPGQVVEFQAMCDYDGESQRTVRDGSARAWWVEN